MSRTHHGAFSTEYETTHQVQTADPWLTVREYNGYFAIDMEL